jgi:hypothetical protein
VSDQLAACNATNAVPGHAFDTKLASCYIRTVQCQVHRQIELLYTVTKCDAFL